MGLAATQTRFLSLTAKKSNIEYQGQQINQQRTVLSNKSSNLYSQMLTISVPVPPTTSDYTKIQYQYVSGNATFRTTSYNFEGETKTATVKNIATGAITTVAISSVEKDDTTGRYSAMNGLSLTPVEVTDNDAYQDAYNQYTYKQYLYEQEMDLINAKTEILQQQDKTLELQLKQLDTEQSAISTELEALDKVLGDHVEKSYNAFGG